MANISLEFLCESSHWETALPDPKALFQRASLAAFAVADWRDAAQISILLTDNAHIQTLNAEFRYKNAATNVLSFPSPANMTPPQMDRILGDLAFAFETIQAEAKIEAKSFADHMTHLIIHGVLHLLDYDHENDSEAKIMEALEIKALQGLGIKSPYPDEESCSVPFEKDLLLKGSTQ